MAKEEKEEEEEALLLPFLSYSNTFLLLFFSLPFLPFFWPFGGGGEILSRREKERGKSKGRKVKALGESEGGKYFVSLRSVSAVI